MRRPALVLAATTAFASAALLPGAPALRAERDPMERLATQRLTWKPCFTEKNQKAAYRRLECSTLQAPLDWRRPEGKKITLAISRLKARKRVKGVLFTNPGGPGFEGRTLPLQFIEHKRHRILDDMDVIGLDVRGSGASTPVSCKKLQGAALDSRDRGDGGTERLLARMKEQAAACQGNGGRLPARYVTTAQTVYDLEWIRRNLKTSRGAGVGRIDWIGYSAGTWLGAYYAKRWPRSTGRFVLDSVVDFGGTWEQLFDSWPRSFQARFEQFADWAARYNGTFQLGTTRDAVLRRYERIRAAIIAQGGLTLVSTDGTTSAFHATDFDMQIVSQLYSKKDFSPLARFLSDLSPLTSAKTRSALSVRPASPAPPAGPGAAAPIPGGEPALFDVTCNDTPFTRTPAQVAAFSEELGRRYPLFGYHLIQDPCMYWKRPTDQLRLARPVGGGLPRILLVQSTGDPATPYEGAVRAHRAYRGSRLITVEGEGDHGIYVQTANPCVDKIVERYLIDGVYPRHDLTCPGMPLPTPSAKADSPAAGIGKSTELHVVPGS